MRIEFFDDPSEMYKDPVDVRMQSVDVAPFADGRRVSVAFRLTPFRERPSLEASIIDGNGQLVSTLNVIETLSPQFSLTMHLRDGRSGGTYQLHVEVYYTKPGEARTTVDNFSTSFELHPARHE